MSRRHRSRTSRLSSQPSSPTVAEAAPLEQPDVLPFTVRYAQTEPDMVAIHRFLMVVAQPAFQCALDVEKSLIEVIRVVRDEAAIMLMQGDMLIGTMGLIKHRWWYGQDEFLTDRWHFVLPSLMHSPGAGLLIDEAVAIAGAAGMKFYHQGKIRPARNGVHLMFPRVYDPAESDVV